MRTTPSHATLLVLVLGWVTACAQGVPADGTDDGDDDPGSPDATAATVDAAATPDAAVGDPADARVIDAGPDARPAPVVLSQNTSTTTTQGVVVCVSDIGILLPRIVVNENSYYRVFSLADAGVTGAFDASQVDFSVWTATAGGFSGGMQAAKVRLHTLTGTTLTTAALTQLASVDIEIADTRGSRAVSVPITAAVPAGATLVAEILVPNGITAGNMLQLGANTGGERGPSYWRGPDCGTGIRPFADVEQAHQIVLTVTGTPR